MQPNFQKLCQFQLIFFPSVSLAQGSHLVIKVTGFLSLNEETVTDEWSLMGCLLETLINYEIVLRLLSNKTTMKAGEWILWPVLRNALQLIVRNDDQEPAKP